MKLFLTAIALLCCIMSGQAQFYAMATEKPANTSPVVQRSGNDVSYTITRPPGLRMRNTGRALTIIGGSMLIGGIIVVSNAETDYYNSYTTSNGTYSEDDAQAALGVLMIAGGTGMTIPGIIFWSKGAKKYKRHLEREAAFNFTGRGFSLSYRF